MATCGLELQRALLDVLRSIDCEFAVLHNWDDVLALKTKTDIDLATNQPIKQIIKDVAKRLDHHRVTLIFVSRYDVGSYSTFWISNNFEQYCQLDILKDPHGLGNLGIRSNEFVVSAGGNKTLKNVSPISEMFYIISKRLFKGHEFEPKEAAIISEHKQHVNRHLIRKMTRASGRIRILRYFKLRVSILEYFISLVFSLMRKTYRFSLRPGLIIEAGSSDSALAAYDRLNSVVPQVKVFSKNWRNTLKIKFYQSTNSVILVFNEDDESVSFQEVVQRLNVKSIKKLNRRWR